MSFNPSTIPAPGSGNSTMTFTVGSSTPVGTYPITVDGGWRGDSADRDGQPDGYDKPGDSDSVGIRPLR